MAERIEFSQKVRRAAYARADGVCECGCGQMFGNHPKSRPVYDHRIPAKLGGRATLDNCDCIRLDCHNVKTATEDLPRIGKVRREDKRRTGTERTKQKIPGSKGTGMRKKLNGEVVWE